MVADVVSTIASARSRINDVITVAIVAVFSGNDKRKSASRGLVGKKISIFQVASIYSDMWRFPTGILGLC